MKKENYSEEAWQRYLIRSREKSLKYYYSHKKEHTEYQRKYQASRKVLDNEYKLRSNFCWDIDLVENYSLAKKDNFEGWHLHHRLENYWSRTTLKKKHLYYTLNPESLIFLPEEEHSADSGLSTTNKNKTKWHQRKLEND